tara:strand:- start:1068 stop:1280 length:213 start_codon:yes stop_codon:yes gene_type:complete
MKKLLLVLLIGLTSCIVPQHIESDKCCDKHTYIPTYYQPTRVVIIKKDKPIYKRNIKVKINKHRKTIKRK